MRERRGAYILQNLDAFSLVSCLTEERRKRVERGGEIYLPVGVDLAEVSDESSQKSPR